MTIALWCGLIAMLLPYVCFGIARNRGRGPDGRCLRDNHDPRGFPNRIRGVAKRAWDAQLNSFELLPGFAPAVHRPLGARSAASGRCARPWFGSWRGWLMWRSTWETRLRCGRRRSSSAWLAYLGFSSRPVWRKRSTRGGCGHHQRQGVVSARGEDELLQPRRVDEQFLAQLLRRVDLEFERHARELTGEPRQVIGAHAQQHAVSRRFEQADRG